MNYYLIDTDKSGLTGVPISLNARIHESFDENNPMAPMKDYNWDTMLLEKVILPEKLFLICKSRQIIFDYYYHISGFIISEKFKILLELFEVNGYQFTNLEVLSWKGELISSQKYFYLRFFRAIKAVDTLKSNVLPVFNEKGDVEYNDDGSIWIERYESVILREDLIKNENLFSIDDPLLYPYLICSEKFKVIAKKNKVYGLKFIPIDRIPDFLSSI